MEPDGVHNSARGMHNSAYTEPKIIYKIICFTKKTVPVFNMSISEEAIYIRPSLRVNHEGRYDHRALVAVR